MSTKRDILNKAKRERHKVRRAKRLAEWKTSYRLFKVKQHQAFVAMAKAVAALKAKFKAMQKEQMKQKAE